MEMILLITQAAQSDYQAGYCEAGQPETDTSEPGSALQGPSRLQLFQFDGLKHPRCEIRGDRNIGQRQHKLLEEHFLLPVRLRFRMDQEIRFQAGLFLSSQWT